MARYRRIESESSDGCWTLIRKEPEPANARWIVGIEGYEEAHASPVVRRELPSAIIPVILVLDEGFSLHDEHGSVRSLERSFTAGLTGNHVLIGSHGKATCLQINLTPQGARRLFRIDMQEIAGRVVDLEEILGAESEILVDRLANMPGWVQRLDHLESVVAEKIAAGFADSALAAAAGKAIVNSKGAVSIVGLAGDLGVSRKHLHRRFRQDFGLAPKAFARIVRFQSALSWLEHGEWTSLADLAVACGYADQAHFNRDFRAFSGVSPGSLLVQRLPDGSVGTTGT